MSKIKVSVTWGDGPDMLIVNEGKSYILYDDPSMKDRFVHGISLKGSFDLSLKEAIELRNSLNMAIFNVEELNRLSKEFFDSEFFDSIDECENETIQNI